MDLVKDPKGEFFFVDDKKLGLFPHSGQLYGAISLQRPELMLQTVSDRDCRRLASIEELPDAVRALLAAKKALSRGTRGSLGRFESTIIRVIDELQAILDPEDSSRNSNS